LRAVWKLVGAQPRPRNTSTLKPLVEHAQRGDGQAFGQLYEQFVSRLYSFFYHQLQGQSHLAEDLTEEVFVKVIEKLNQYQDRGLPFAAWVFRIASQPLD
jgi:RNA polymerase sigma-70 factor (ECF subfamily)